MTKLSTKIHELAIVEKGAFIGKNSVIGPFCHVGGKVVLGENTELISHVSIQGDTKIGKNARVFPFASIGSEPQDLKYEGEKSKLVIGDKCIIRESVTINTGTKGGGFITKIGDQCTFLTGSHVAHDCLIGNQVILSNNAMIAGHCSVGNRVIFGGGAALHQFCRVGEQAFIGGLAGVEGDVVPFGVVMGNRAKLAGLNLIGMKRAGIQRDKIHAVRNAFKFIFDGKQPIQTKAQKLREKEKEKLVLEILNFILVQSERALCVPDNRFSV